MFCLTFQDVVREFPQKHPVYLSRILADMVEKGMQYKITRGNYHIIPFNADPETYVPDGHQVAKYIMQNKEYYIGYASAMKIHGLTLQSDVKEYDVKVYVVTKKQTKPAIMSFRGITYQFIQHDATRYFSSDFKKERVRELDNNLVCIADICRRYNTKHKMLLIMRISLQDISRFQQQIISI